MTSRLLELIQQLREAISESVTESEQIAGVVEDIRRQGFDVMLMLEASIALNDIAAQETDQIEVPAGRNSSDPAFTQNDLSFLRSLRISVNGEKEDDARLK